MSEQSSPCATIVSAAPYSVVFLNARFASKKPCFPNPFAGEISFHPCARALRLQANTGFQAK
jgi:hypothetical protein